jgi:predicted nucleic acid-binding protein
MRDLFPGFYAPSEQEHDELARVGRIVVDTSVLLAIHELPPASRDELLAILRSIQERLWIPHLVALEYQTGRVGVIERSRSALRRAREELKKALSTIHSATASAKLEQRASKSKTGASLQAIEKRVEHLCSSLDDALEDHQLPSRTDPIRDQLDQILNGRVGPPWPTEADLADVVAEADSRFAAQRPPGFADSNKGGDVYINGLAVPRKYSDYIIWRQILSGAAANDVNTLLFVTNDLKEDWWQTANGRAADPRWELVEEAQRGTTVRLFWMYSLEEFMERVGKLAGLAQSEQSVNEVRELSARESHVSDSVSGESGARSSPGLGPLLSDIDERRRIRDVVRAYVRDYFTHHESLRSRSDGLMFRSMDGSILEVHVLAISHGLGSYSWASSLKSLLSEQFVKLARGQLQHAIVIVACDLAFYSANEHELARKCQAAWEFVEAGELWLGFVDGSRFACVTQYS